MCVRICVYFVICILLNGCSSYPHIKDREWTNLDATYLIAAKADLCIKLWDNSELITSYMRHYTHSHSKMHDRYKAMVQIDPEAAKAFWEQAKLEARERARNVSYLPYTRGNLVRYTLKVKLGHYDKEVGGFPISGSSLHDGIISSSYRDNDVSRYLHFDSRYVANGMDSSESIRLIAGSLMAVYGTVDAEDVLRSKAQIERTNPGLLPKSGSVSLHSIHRFDQSSKPFRVNPSNKIVYLVPGESLVREFNEEWMASGKAPDLVLAALVSIDHCSEIEGEIQTLLSGEFYQLTLHKHSVNSDPLVIWVKEGVATTE